MKLEPGLQPLSTAVAVLLEQAYRARENGDWSITGALLESASTLCWMIRQRQEETAREEEKNA